MAPNGKVISGLRWFLNFMVAQGYPEDRVEEVRTNLYFLLFSLFSNSLILLDFLFSPQ